MKYLDVILIVIGAAVCLFLLIPAKKRKIGPYWLTFAVPAVVGAMIIAAVITNIVQATPPSQQQMHSRMEMQGFNPTDITQHDEANYPYNSGRIHNILSCDVGFTVTWFQFSFENDGRNHISHVTEDLLSADSRCGTDYFYGKHTMRCEITSGSSYRLLIVYDDTLLEIQGTAEQKDAIQKAADTLGYWE